MGLSLFLHVGPYKSYLTSLVCYHLPPVTIVMWKFLHHILAVQYVHDVCIYMINSIRVVEVYYEEMISKCAYNQLAHALF